MAEVSSHLHAGIAALRENRNAGAVASFGAAVRLAPEDAEVLSLYGLALARAGRMEEAAAPLQRAVELEPGQAGFRLNLSEFYERSGRDADAARELNLIVAREPRFVEAWRRLTGALTRSGAWSELATAGAAWLRVAPGDTDALEALARAAFEHGDIAGARAAYAARRRALPQSVEAHCAYGVCCLTAGDCYEAAAAFDDAERLAPDNIDVLAGKARLLTYLGRFAEAESYCRRCLAIDPECVAAYTTLSQLTHGRLSAEARETLSRIAANDAAPANQRANAAYTLARSYDVDRNVETAFAWYATANGFAASRDGGYDPARAEARTRLIMERAEGATPARACGGSPTPIFIIGMPRSGTTLLESVLSAHSQVCGKGELGAMPLVLQAWLTTPELDAAQMDAWARAYVDAAMPIGSASYFTDKMPPNYEAAALIAKLFPDAPIIHVRRNALETGFSIYRQGLSRFLTYANRLEDIAHAYGQYARLMAHWQRVLGDRIVTIQYEDFVTDFDIAAPRLVAACGLEWEEACRNFQDAERAISTFSTVQVRQPLALRPSAPRYAKHLAPLREALEGEGVDVETGAYRGA